MATVTASAPPTSRPASTPRKRRAQRSTCFVAWSSPVTADGVLFSFTPVGTSSSGTFYLTREGARFAVRVLGATGRARVFATCAAANGARVTSERRRRATGSPPMAIRCRGPGCARVPNSPSPKSPTSARWSHERSTAARHACRGAPDDAWRPRAARARASLGRQCSMLRPGLPGRAGIRLPCGLVVARVVLPQDEPPP